MNKPAVIAYGKIDSSSTNDEKDIISEIAFIKSAFNNLYKETELIELPVSLDLDKFIKTINSLKPYFVFNLVESLSFNDRYIFFVPTILEELSIPFSGSNSETIFKSSNKILAKEIMQQNGLPTPPWRYIGNGNSAKQQQTDFPCIIKPVFNHASSGIDDKSVILNKNDFLRHPIKRNYFIEKYIDGREINISLLDSENGPVILPPAEIVFNKYPKGKPKIVNYDAKWEDSSFEYHNTIRTFDFSPSDNELLQEIKKISLLCWKIFNLKGYARVDFRVDSNNKPWILEINANPCLSNDSGYIAATIKAKIPDKEVVKRLIKHSS